MNSSQSCEQPVEVRSQCYIMETNKCPVVIPNSLADVILLVGVDDCTGLTPVDGNECASVYDSLFELQYEPRVITALSATDMVNFTPFTHRVASYPPVFSKEVLKLNQTEVMGRQRDRLMNEFSMANKKMSFHPSKSMRSVSVGPKMFRTMSVVRPGGSGSTISTIPELPISDEVINSISTFCYPDGLKVYERKPENRSHFFVLTDISGHRTYATCLTFYRAYVADKDGSDNVYLTLGKEAKVEDGQMVCYMPQCCVAISKYPYYTTLKECLSSMLMYIEKDPEETVGFLKEYANIMTHTPVPPAGNIAVNFCVYNMPVTIMPPTHPDKPVIDLPLYLTLSCFQPEEFLRVLSCILMEEKIVFLCSNYSLLTIVMESLMHLILPFKWRFTYSTILPAAALGFLEAPGIFMYGVHRSHKEEVEQVDDLVLVDIDEGTVQIQHSSKQRRNGQQPDVIEVPNIPADLATTLKNKWNKLRPRYDLEDTRRPFCYIIEEHRQFHLKRIRDQNIIIAAACLELMVNLYKDVVGMLRVEHNHFNKEQFLQEHTENRLFYEKVFKTDMFKTFLTDRIKEKPDYWSDLEMKNRGYGQTKSTQSSVVYQNKPRRYTLSHITPGDNRVITKFYLKDITDLKVYVKNTIQQITKEMETSLDHDCWTSLLHLRALYHCGDGNKMAAMDDFIKLATAKNRILPTNVLSDLYNQLSDEERVLFKKKQGHEMLLDFIENDDGQERARIRMDPIEIPDTDLNFFKFEDFVSLKQMSDDHKTIKLLFEALTQEDISKKHEIKQMTFQMFVCCWEDNQCDCKHLKIKGWTLSEDELILKVSKYIIKTDFGLGRIVLTNKRLFFVSDVSNKYKEITLLRDIKTLEKSICSSLFSKVPTLKINKKNGTSFTAYMKDERNWWYMVIYEMWAGKVMAEAMKDVMMIHHAVQTTLLIDAVIASGQQECTTHSHNVEGAAERLCIYSSMMQNGKHILPKDTKEALQRKIDVNIGEKESKTVQSLLYTGGGENTAPRLWCGFTDGRIKIFNAITWLPESEIFLNFNQVVACLTDVGGDQVWAGAYGIYIIDSLTLTSTKTLLDHVDLVVSIVVYDSRSVYTASLDGTIIKWNKQKLTHSQEIKLTSIKSLRALKISNDRLICGSWSSILVCDLEATVLNVLEAKENDRVIEIDSFTVTPYGQIWAGGRRLGKLYIWELGTGECQKCVTIDNCRGISSMEEVDGRVWVGTKDGIIYVYTVKDQKLWKKLEGHDDAVRVQCDVRDRYMVSGGGSKDGRVCIWKSTDSSNEFSQCLINSDEIQTKL